MALDTSYIDQFFIASDGPSVTVIHNAISISVVPVVDYSDSGGMSGSNILYDGKESDWSSANKGDAVTINSIAHVIAELKPNEEGWIRIKMRRT